MSHPSNSILIILTLALIAASPALYSAEPYSSEYTRKWAAQREAQMERNRQQEQRQLESERQRQQQLQMMNQIFHIEETQGGTDVNSTPQRRRPAEPAPVQPTADFGDQGFTDGCLSATDGQYYPDGTPYWGYMHGLFGSEGSSTCGVCKNNKWKGLKYTNCSKPYPN